MSNMLDLLEAGVPFTLLMDLFGDDAPHSRDLYLNELDDASWVPARTVA